MGNMSKKTVTGALAVLALGLFGVMGAARATIISETPNINFSNGTYTLNLANGAASFSFKDSAPGNFFDPAAIKTGGSGLVASNPPILGGGPAAYFTGSRAPFISGDLLAIFKAYDTYAVIQYSGTPTYVGLAFDLADGRHYGYAEISGPQFISYGYQTVAGEGIRAGAVGSPPTSVPEPGSLAMLSFGLLLIGVGATAARRRKS